MNLSSGSTAFKKWHRNTEVAIERVFGQNTRHLSDFKEIRYNLSGSTHLTTEADYHDAYQTGLQTADAILQSMIDEVESYWGTDPTASPSALPTLETLCRRFPLAARQLQARHAKRPAFEVRDEYDVQDLLHALLHMSYNDVRPEEYGPSHGGASPRIDFLLKEQKIALEIKMTRAGLGSKEIGEQLATDIERYRDHPYCRTLLCFVYDPEHRISNPVGFEADLAGDRGGLDVKVIVAPQ